MIAMRWTTAFVDPPIAWSTVIALRKDSFDRIVCGLREERLAATETARDPVSSAMRMRAAETAGADAPPSGIKPKAAAMQAIVL